VGNDEAVNVWKVRLKVDELSPKINRRLNHLDEAAEEISLPLTLQELVRVRASQINHCAYCVEGHVPEARKVGVTEEQLATLAVWPESPFFTARERAALQLTEWMTRLPDGPVTDEQWAQVSAEFTEVELSELVWTITIINVWNRVAGVARPWDIGE
jgi:AhpD family alkylhydroperoxidase